MPVKVVATCAADTPQAAGYDEFRQMLDQNDGCYLIVLGTAWGLTGVHHTGPHYGKRQVGNRFRTFYKFINFKNCKISLAPWPLFGHIRSASVKQVHII